MVDLKFTNEALIQIVWESFARSHDFNGITLRGLAREANLDVDSLNEKLRFLIEEGKVSLAFESVSENPHIKRLTDLSPDAQIKKMETEDPSGICVYPSTNLARLRIGKSFRDRPYTRRLAMAEPQLEPVFFDLQVLERYFRDPRYVCWFEDSAGSISIGDRAYGSDETRDGDKITIQSFGIGYNLRRQRVVVVFLRYLSDLSVEHQRYWVAHEVKEECTINSDYERASIWGMWPENHSVYAAFIQEQVEINKLCGLIGKPHLFKRTYEDNKRPLLFCSMLRPTRASFDDFVHLLDKMISENIDKEFFIGDIPTEEERQRKNGSVEVHQLGTLTLLERWLKRHYRTRDREDVSAETTCSFKKVRKSRQPAAHVIGRDIYDLSLPNQQDELLAEVKNGLTRLRWILTSHPDVHHYIAPEWLDGNRIVVY